MMLLPCFVLLFLVHGSICPSTPRSTGYPNITATITFDEQRAWIHLECATNAQPTEIYNRLCERVGSNAFSRSYVLQLIREFRDGRRTESCIAPRYGRPQTATNAYMQEMVQEIMEDLDGAKSQDVADRLGVSRDSVRRMLQDMGFRYIMRRWVPHELTSDLRQRRVQTARFNLNRLSREPDLLDRIIAIDETWLFISFILFLIEFTIFWFKRYKIQKRKQTWYLIKIINTY